MECLRLTSNTTATDIALLFTQTLRYILLKFIIINRWLSAITVIFVCEITIRDTVHRVSARLAVDKRKGLLKIAQTINCNGFYPRIRWVAMGADEDRQKSHGRRAIRYISPPRCFSTAKSCVYVCMLTIRIVNYNWELIRALANLTSRADVIVFNTRSVN